MGKRKKKEEKKMEEKAKVEKQKEMKRLKMEEKEQKKEGGGRNQETSKAGRGKAVKGQEAEEEQWSRGAKPILGVCVQRAQLRNTKTPPEVTEDLTPTGGQKKEA